tara:strand:- start:31075 stop:31434 length:360 start_codon:yes stop_codon:yes gene_type:complete
MNELVKLGSLSYLRQRREVHDDMFEPVSKSQWRLLRELSLGKSTNSYLQYVERCNESYLNEIRMRKECSLELSSVMWNLDELDKTQNELIGIQEASDFKNWINDEAKGLVSRILKLEDE